MDNVHPGGRNRAKRVIPPAVDEIAANEERFHRKQLRIIKAGNLPVYEHD